MLTSPVANLAQQVEIRSITPNDITAISTLHRDRFGPGRFSRTAYRIREGAPLISPHCLSAWLDGAFVGSVTMTAITVGATDGHWLLGPLAVRKDMDGKGVGRRLIMEAQQSVVNGEADTATIVLVGDFDYYGRLGFVRVPPGQITLPGPVARDRILIWRGPAGDRDIPRGRIRHA